LAGVRRFELESSFNFGELDRRSIDKRICEKRQGEDLQAGGQGSFDRDDRPMAQTIASTFAAGWARGLPVALHRLMFVATLANGGRIFAAG
jgi:hypothetical protein